MIFFISFSLLFFFKIDPFFILYHAFILFVVRKSYFYYVAVRDF